MSFSLNTQPIPLLNQTNIQDQLIESFKAPTISCYWHYIAKNTRNAAVFKSHKMGEMILRLGEDSLTQPSSFGWTPLHVAVIAGNFSATRFFLNHGGGPTKKDLEEKTPLDYCRMINHPDILELLLSKEFSRETAAAPPSTNGLASGVPLMAMRELFRQWHVSLSTTPFIYQANTHDFGVQIDQLMFRKPDDDSLEAQLNYLEEKVRNKYLTQNLVEIAATMGFELIFSNYPYFVRDMLIRLPNGSILSPSTSENALIACERAFSKNFIERTSSIGRTQHCFFHGMIGAGIQSLASSTAEIRDRFKHEQTLRFYMEGGNHYLSSNGSGELRLLMGEDHLTIALNQMRLDKTFDDPLIDLQGKTKTIKDELNEERIREILPEMYAQGLLKPRKGAEKGFITSLEVEQLCLEEGPALNDGASNYFEMAIRKGIYHPLNLSTEDVLNSKEIVAKYLAQKEITEEIIRLSFSIPENSVYFIPQAGYHLDTFMRPGPKGSFFVQNYVFCIAILESMQTLAADLELSDLDKDILERYLKTANQLHRDIGPVLEQAGIQLKRAGFQVIPTPGVFFDISPRHPEEPTYNVNFLNAISGWSAKANAFYYIATGASVGNKLGILLMQAFHQFLETYQAGIHVDFIGHPPDNKTDFNEAMEWWNRPESQAGPHCFSLEIKTTSKSG